MDYFTLTNIWILVFSVLFAAGSVLALSYRTMQGYQLSGYRFSRYFKWLFTARSKAFTRLMFVAAMSALTLLVFNALFYSLIGDYTVLISIVFCAAFMGMYLYAEVKFKNRTPLKYTPRVIRLMTVLGVLGALYGLACIYTMDMGYYVFTGIMFAVTPAAVLVLLPVAALIMAPIEKLNSYRYILKAKKKIAGSHAKMIAITGSCGKTSVKNYLCDILNNRFRCVMTPESFNTPMGVVRSVLSDLKDDTDIFIVEMGARQKGDIRYLAGIVPPDVSVITAIAPQHMEYFHTIENIENTKYELAEALKPGGVAFFGDESTRKLYDKCPAEKYRIAELNADGFAHEQTKTVFEIDGVRFQTGIIGRHNINSLLLAILIAKHFGMTLAEISEAVKSVEAVDHRLKVIRSENDITIIDDTYNTNPVSAKAAIEAVAEFEGEKVIVTPGFVEQGKNLTEEHRKLAEEIYPVFERVILIGKIQTRDIYARLVELGKPEENILVFRSLLDAENQFASTIAPGNIVFLLNDLPDNFAECE